MIQENSFIIIFITIIVMPIFTFMGGKIKCKDFRKKNMTDHKVTASELLTDKVCKSGLGSMNIPG